ncbi:MULTISPECIES: NAD(P)-dependent alcohol dehydrogenase [Mycobacterium]|uniref:Aryl-alcohol dehydrogenase n=1 Tax=Mycobacterium kiyosense TaxID=2871094 RepID=A0A9P3Q8D6_9MYCO|nr:MULTISPECIES: NAD(P)-dependent alcohol dehydrogenase [Mycobacterium]BDB39680.1 aryl-alcohol dehydrogenase [Mycobacterium kiyosense]BDE11537.1 aryl-alcohol dehydrogenase [Mycobacterium sp. 20KCMC460]GLB82379.1 aryl-alcohol dehydrogenase [Mycobacterium kiyosense]GLB88914.1 aryl-alcohol dehydrogenase [Mycobacterium kiyosense]GLB95594.1 aryl-alcohol dehydrogenase [Mycobacterium kiyosense]
MTHTASQIPTVDRPIAPHAARAAVLRAEGEPLSVEDVQLAELAEDEILVRVAGVGVCHTDISAAEGMVPLPLPAVLGHEGAGVVVDVGSAVTTVTVGDHVVLSFAYCDECDTCRNKTPAYCDLFAPLNYFGERLDGTVTLHAVDEDIHGNWFGQSSFASLAIASARNAVKVPADLPLQLLGPLGCGLQTGAGAVLNVLRPAAGESLAVFGLGAVGLSAIMAGKAVGCDPLIAIDINDSRLQTARELGATHTFNPTASQDLVWDVMNIVSTGVDCSLDAVGSNTVIRQALEILRSPGHCATVGFHGLQHDITIDQGHLLLGRRLSGVIEGDADPQKFLPELIELYRDGKFPFDRLITTFSLDRINEAIEASKRGEAIKPVVIFD